jgi:superfamily II DNA or RNA helicase
MHIVITRVDGALRVNPAPPYIIDYLKYHHRSFGKRGYKTVNKFEERLLHETDGSGGVTTLPGFFEHIANMIHKRGDTYEVDDLRTPLPETDWKAIKDINWKAIGSTGLRDYQVDPVVEFLFKLQQNSGIVNAAGGYGKTILQAVTYAAFNKLNTILAIPLKQVFTQTYEKFVKLFPNKQIGRVGDGYRELSPDITITTFKSLKNCSVEKCRLLLVDEIQQTTGDSISEGLVSMTPIRSVGYTATDKGLFNGADKVIKGLFGERLIYIPYKEAEEVNAVVPGLVYFVRMPDDVHINATSIEGKISQGIKNCAPRNKLIAEICKTVPDRWQTLIFVDHVADHLVKLHKEMPVGTKYIHRETSKKKVDTYALTDKQQNKIIDEYQNNEFQYLIATDAFRAGVDIPNCRVVVQASGGTSEIEILQEAFRGSRILPEELRESLDVDPKTHFVLIDILDTHDPTLESMSYKRMDIYKKQGWQIKTVNLPSEIDWFDFKKKGLTS